MTLSREIRQGLRDPDLDADRVYGYVLAIKALDVELEKLRGEFETLWFAHKFGSPQLVEGFRPWW